MAYGDVCWECEGMSVGSVRGCEKRRFNFLGRYPAFRVFQVLTVVLGSARASDEQIFKQETAESSALRGLKMMVDKFQRIFKLNLCRTYLFCEQDVNLL